MVSRKPLIDTRLGGAVAGPLPMAHEERFMRTSIRFACAGFDSALARAHTHNEGCFSFAAVIRHHTPRSIA